LCGIDKAKKNILQLIPDCCELAKSSQFRDERKGLLQLIG